MLNIDYKLITKAIINHIEDSLTDVISDTQAANIPNRSAQNIITIISNIIHWLNKTQNTNYLVSIESEKSFDRVDHNYMFRCLEKANIKTSLINKIKLLYNGMFSKSYGPWLCHKIL